MTGVEELGRGGRLRGGAAGELVAAAYAAESAHGPRLAHGLSLADLAHAVALVEGGDARTARTRAALLRGLLELARDPGRRVSLGPGRRRRLQRARGRARAARRALGRRLAERGSAAPRGVPRRPAPDGARTARSTCTTRSAIRPRRSARHARDTQDGARRRLHLPAAGTADDRRATCCSPTPTRRCATPSVCAPRARARSARASPAPAAAPARAGRSTASRLAELLGCEALVEHAKDAAWQADVYVELLAALAIAATHQIAARRRTSRSTPARSSASSSSPTRTAARAR